MAIKHLARLKIAAVFAAMVLYAWPHIYLLEAMDSLTGDLGLGISTLFALLLFLKPITFVLDQMEILRA